MMFINFDSSLRLGYAPIDQDHERIAKQINEVLELIWSKRNRDQIKAACGVLADTTSAHFRREEHLMEKCGYPDMHFHVNRHNRLINELQERFRDILKSSDEDLMEQISFIHEWFVFHIKTSDRKLAEFLKAQD